ncbi:uncharacterized protein LOC112050094 [Bicyclus anynana]|uniref:Uncharacterized protein LOC112050094 n=1 Tax=Bicyclus anynana TaxID=110368 RepID=A0A6J1NGB7_BICAN|nr:uncharacterized protein LOC112050094 [Bicyclus anynana]
MGRRSYVGALLALSLIANAFSFPTSELRIKRQSPDSTDLTNTDSVVKDNNDIDDDDDDDFPTYPQNDSSGGGSNLFSLLNLVTAFLPGSSSSSGNQEKTPEEEGPSPLWTLKLDILRAIFQFGTSILGLASSSSSSSVLSASSG